MICDLGQSVYFDNTNLYIIHGKTICSSMRKR